MTKKIDVVYFDEANMLTPKQFAELNKRLDSIQHKPPIMIQTTQPQGVVLRRRQSVALVLAVMLGPLGVDRFYLGNPGLGLLKLFTAGMFGFMWIIDIILIATKSVRGIDWV